MASPTLRSDRALSRATCALVGVMLSLAGPLHAQNPADSATVADTGSTMIRAVELERRDIFDPDEHGWIARLGNALHIQTRPGTIRRELLFQPGEVYDSAKFAESERNLRALGVFRRVRIDTVRTDSGLVARVLTKDGWSTQSTIGSAARAGKSSSRLV